MTEPWFSDEGWWNNPNDFLFGAPEPPTDVNEILFGPQYVQDQHAQDLFKEAFFDDNNRSYIDLIDYMWTRYGIDFEDSFSWADFRDYIDANGTP